MYRVVMVPTDGSDASLHAIPLALAIARPSNAAVHLVTVMEAAVVAPIYGVPIAAGGWTSGALVDPATLADADALSRQSQQRALHEFAERVAMDAGVTVVPSLIEGDVVESLQRYAEAQAVDLVVLTTHGRGGIGRALFGSVTDSLMGRVSCPVLVARPVQPAVARGLSEDQGHQPLRRSHQASRYPQITTEDAPPPPGRARISSY